MSTIEGDTKSSLQTRVVRHFAAMAIVAYHNLTTLMGEETLGYGRTA